jgi:hypothetical protein
MPISPKKSPWSLPWSLPQDYFVEELRDPQARATRLRRLKRERWWLIGGGTLFLLLGILQLFIAENSQFDFFLFILILYYAISFQENRCQQYIVELAELLSREKGESN